MAVLPVSSPDTARIHPGEVIGVINQKGGAGKTTSTVGLAAVLAEAGARVRVIDADPQKAALSLWLAPQGMDADGPDLGKVYLGECALDQATYPTVVPGVDIVPSSKSLTKFEKDDEIIGKDMLLRRALNKSERPYDVTLVDHAPNLQQNSLTALVACDALVVPALAGSLDLEGISDLNETLETVKDVYRPDQRVVAVLITQAMSNNLTKDAVEVLEGDFPGALHAKIRYTVRVREAPAAREPLTVYAPTSTAALDYKAAAEALFAPVLESVEASRG